MAKKTKRKLAIPKLPLQRQLNFPHEGEYFDLREIFDRLNERHFRNRLRGYKVVWGRRRKQRPKDCFVFGTIQEASWFYDQPLVHGNDAHMLALSKYAKPRVTVLLSGERAELILLGVNGPAPTLDLDRVEARLAEDPAVLADLQAVRMGALTELAGAFVADADALARATAGVAPVTDDLPSMEYTLVNDASPMEIPKEIFALGGIHAFCPSCWAGATPTARVKDLDRYQRVLGAFYGTRAFLTTHYPVEIEDTDGTLGEVIAKSAYLRAILGLD